MCKLQSNTQKQTAVMKLKQLFGMTETASITENSLMNLRLCG